MTKENTKKSTATVIEEFLTKTGFILEMEVSELLMKLGYAIEINSYFYDYDEGKKREIDIIAIKKVDNITLSLIIECKQSLVDDWIFICSDKKPKRYYQYIKHLPYAEKFDETKLFHNLHIFDKSIPLAQNYIIKDKSDKKSTSLQIETCLEKLPKALIDLAYSKNGGNDREIYLPLAVFSGQIFSAQYNKRLKAKSVDWVQYESNLESDNYRYHYPHLPTTYVRLFSEKETEETKEKNSPVASISQELGSKYLIDFVTKKGLSKLISRVESGIKALNLDKWPISKEKKE